MKIEDEKNNIEDIKLCLVKIISSVDEKINIYKSLNKIMDSLNKTLIEIKNDQLHT